MKPQCASVVQQILGREPRKGELDAIESRIYSSMRELQAQDPARWRGLSRDQRLQEGAKLASQKSLQDVTRAHANTLRDMETKAGQMRKLESYAPGTGKGKGQLAALRQRAVFNAGAKGDLSVEIQRKAVFKDLVRRLGDIGGQGKFFGLVQDPREQADLMRAIRNEPTGRPDVDSAGDTVRKVMDEAFQQMNDVGIHINRLDDWHTPQPWDWTKVGADREQFVRDAMDAIDPDRYIHQDGRPMTPDDIRKLIEKSSETLGTNGSNKRGEKEGTGYSGTVGGSRNAPRQLHFKDADAYMQMMDKYGSADNVHSLLLHHLNGVARDVAAARVFGRDADNFFPQLVEKAFANDALAVSGKSPEKRAKSLENLERLKKRTMKEWQAMRQPDHPGSMPGWVKVSQAIRGLAGASLLGSSTLSAIPDLQMAVGYTHLLGISRSKILGNVAEGLKPTAENRKNISRLGIVVDGLEGAANRFGSEELGPHAIRFLNHAVHVGSGLRMWDRGMSHGVSASIMDMLGEHVNKSDYTHLDAKTKAYLDARGITEDHWKTWQLADLDKGQDGSRTMLTPDSIYDIPDEKLRPMAEQRLATMDGQFKADAAKRDERTAEEIKWVEKRSTDFDALREKVRDTLAKARAKNSISEGRAEGIHDARAEQLQREMTLAEIELKLNRTLAVEKSQDRVRGILTDVAKAQAEAEAQFRGEPGEIDAEGNPIRRPENAAGVMENPSTDNASKRAVNAGMTIGEELGRRRAIAERRVADSKRRVEQLGRDNQAAYDDKSKAFARQLDARLTELTEFSQRMRENADQRRRLNDAYEQRYGLELGRETRNLRSEAAQQLIGTALHEVQIGARGGSGSSVSDQVGLMLDPGDRGTLRHELASWLLFLKQTPLGIFKTHMFDVPNGMDDWRAAAVYRAKFMAGSAALGALGLTLKNVVLGQDPEDLFTPKGLAKVAIASGGLGMYGDFMFGDKGDHQNGALAKVLGPGATMMEDALQLAYNARSAASGAAGIEPEKGDQTVRPDQLGAQALRFARNYAAPFSRVWYVKAAFNHMVYNQLMDNLSPGYTARVDARLAQRNQGTWWNAGDMLPNRAPNLSTAVGGQ